MELKFVQQYACTPIPLRLNRTFMELKYKGKRLRRVLLTPFKSHLYGIEISFITFRWLKAKGLNRTFMELKFRTKNPHSSRSRV